MLQVMVTIGAYAASGAMGTVTVGGYVPATCRVGDPLASAGGAVPQATGRNCTVAASLSATVEEGAGEDTVIRVTVTPR